MTKKTEQPSLIEDGELEAILEMSEEEAAAALAAEKLHEAVPLSLALQGNGYLGAFSWGVLDRLSEDGRFDIQAITATGAGALTACAYLQGLRKDGPEAAREEMARLWSGLRTATPENPFQVWLEVMQRLNPFLKFSQAILKTGIVSPYELNPLGIDPLGSYVAEFFDFDALAEADGPVIYVSTTNALTGRLRVFGDRDLNADVLTAANVNPLFMRGVEIDGAPHWEGGITGNPALFPLLEHSADDILLVLPAPTEVETLDTSAQGLRDRIEAIAGNAAFSRELRSFDFVARLIDSGQIEQGRMRRPRFFKVESRVAAGITATRYEASQREFEALFQDGRDVVQNWLDGDANRVGESSPLSREDLFL